MSIFTDPKGLCDSDTPAPGLNRSRVATGDERASAFQCEVAALGDLTDDAKSLEKGLEDDGYGGHLPPDEIHGMHS